eukprot:6212457-Pleurochrysis_carterae.AAC.1
MPTRDQRQVKQACVQPNMCWYALRVRNWSDPVWGPVLEDGVTDNVLSGQEAPVVRVEAVVAIIAQHEDRAGRHSHRRQPVLGRLVGERLLLLLAVDKEAPVAHLRRTRVQPSVSNATHGTRVRTCMCEGVHACGPACAQACMLG